MIFTNQQKEKKKIKEKKIQKFKTVLKGEKQNISTKKQQEQDCRTREVKLGNGGGHIRHRSVSWVQSCNTQAGLGSHTPQGKFGEHHTIKKCPRSTRKPSEQIRMGRAQDRTHTHPHHALGQTCMVLLGQGLDTWGAQRNSNLLMHLGSGQKTTS